MNSAFEEIKGLSVQWPHAGLIAGGFKPVEGRSWRTGHRGLLAIHASSSPVDRAAFELAHVRWSYRLLEHTHPELIVRGSILATARLAGCHAAAPTCTSVWCDPGFAWHWDLEEITTLAEPVACKGTLGLWRLPPDVHRQITIHLSTKGTAHVATC